VSATDSNDLIGDSVDSSIDDPVIRGGTIDFSVDDGFTAAAQAGGGRRIDGGTMILAGVVLASVAGLWSMRFLGTISGQDTLIPAAEQAQVGSWVLEAEKQGAVVGIDDLRILDELDKDRLNDLQVGISDLRSLSPFTYYGEFASKEVVPHEGREYTFEVVRIGRDGVVFVSRLLEPRHERQIEVPVHRDY
jgi:hypothetical protein